MVTVKEEIESFINQMADKLPAFEQVGNEKTWISGREMLLTGLKLESGEPIDKDGSYELQVPILKGVFINGEPSIKPIDHKHKMRLAWLKSGLAGIYSYLNDYLTPAQLNQVKLFFMNRNANEKLRHRATV